MCSPVVCALVLSCSFKAAMAQTTNSSGSLMTASNSTVVVCVPCLYIIPRSYATVLMSSSLLTMPLRGWTLWLLASTPVKEKIDLFGANLVLSDLFLTVLCLLTMSSIFLLHHFFQYTWSVLLSFLIFGRPMLQCFICVERYLAVQHPFVFLRYRSLRYRESILAPAWISVLIVCSVGVALCESERDYITQFLQLQCCILLLIFLINFFCCVSLLTGLMQPPPGDGRRGRDRINRLTHQIKKKSFIIAIMIQVYGLASYFPPAALILSNNIWDQMHFCTFHMFNLWFVLLTSVVFSFHHLHNMGKLTCIHWNKMRTLGVPDTCRLTKPLHALATFIR